MSLTELNLDIQQKSVNSLNSEIASDFNDLRYQPKFHPELIDVDCIRADGGTQPRARVEREVIDDYASAMSSGAVFPPVIVFYDGTTYWLADGYHRVEATKKIGFQKIAADVGQGTRRDALLYSVGANATHGLRRTNADKRRAVMTLLRDPEWSLWSNTAIAKACGVDEALVRSLKSKLSTDDSKISKEALAKKCGVDVSVVLEAKERLESLPKERNAWRNGKKYTVNTEQIGKNSRKKADAELFEQSTINLPDVTSVGDDVLPLFESTNYSGYVNDKLDEQIQQLELQTSQHQAFTLEVSFPLEWRELIEAAALRENKQSVEAWIFDLIRIQINPTG